MVERVNRTILHIASIICKRDGSIWANYVREIEYALNTRISSVTGHSPYELVFGRLPPGPTYTDAIRIADSGEERTGELVRQLRMRIHILQQIAYENQGKAAKHQQDYHNAHAKAHTFEVGDLVRIYRPTQEEKGVGGKLAYVWKGPYVIIEKINPVTYRVMDRQGKILPGTVHSRFMNKTIV